MKMTPKELAAANLSRGLENAYSGNLRGTLEFELFQQATTDAGRPFSEQSFSIPWEMMRHAKRDMTSAGASGSNYLVGTDTVAPVDILRPYSAAIAAGVQLLPNAVGSLAIPKITAGVVGEWLPNEASAITATQPTIVSVSSTPKLAGSMIVFSRLFGLQSQSDSFLRQHLLSGIGQTLDTAIFQGTGNSGQPLGLVGTSGITTVSGASFSWATIAAMEETVGLANASPTAFVGAPTVRKLLTVREKASGSGFIWQGDTLNQRPALVSTNVPSASLLVGPWADIVVPVWGPGPQIEIDPATFFKTGKYQMRVLLAFDVAVRHPGAFVTASSIT